MKRQWSISLAALAAVGIATGVIAQKREQEQKGRTSDARSEAREGGERHVMIRPGQVPWEPGPDALPRGAEIAILEGEIEKTDQLAVRLRFPDGYEIPPHWHPVTERITVLEGELGIGTGEEFDKDAGSTFPEGSFIIMPEGARHFAWAEGETVIQLNGPGPLEIVYVNPADDPRKSE
jgi:quercetin dioxygenase-like cupin family protein